MTARPMCEDIEQQSADVSFAGALGQPLPGYGPHHPFTVARRKIEAYFSLGHEAQEGSVMWMFGLPMNCERTGHISDHQDAVVFLALIQPTLGPLPWNRGRSHDDWTAFPLFGAEAPVTES